MYLIKEAMSVDQAKKVFSIDSIPDEVELKKLYKNLSIQNHPDKGGSLEKMKDINQAYDLLKKAPVGSSFSSGKDVWDVIRKRAAEENKIHYPLMKKMFEDVYDEKEALDYFKKFTDEDLSINVTFSKPVDTNYTYTISLAVTVDIHNADKTTDIVTVFYIKYTEPSSSGLGSSDIDLKDVMYEINVSTSIYHANKKLKLVAQNYQLRVGSKKLAKFSEIYPEDKFKKVFNNASSKKFKKADMLLGLTRELNANIGGDNIFLYPFGKDAKFYMSISRGTFAKMPYYYLNGIQAIHPSTMKYKYYRFSAVTFMEETEEQFRKFVDTVKTVAKEIEKKNIDLVQDYDLVCKAFEKSLQVAFPKKY
jgi:hypothetical protein